MSIVSVTPGDYTPGAASALHMAADVINAAWEQANIKSGAFETKIASSTAGIQDLIDDNSLNISAGTATSAAVVEPDVDIPSSASATDVMTMFDSKYAQLVALLSSEFSGFMAEKFPDDSAVYSSVEDWLQAAVANQSGLPASVVSQLVSDDAARVYADASRASDAVMQTFAARRFPLPPGAAASAVLQIQQNAQDKIAESSRKITVLSIDQLRFAVDKSIGLRQLAMSSAVEYIKALVVGPDIASRLVGVGYDAQSKLISSASQFMGARAEVAKLANQVSQFNVTTALSAAEKNQAAELTLIEDKLKALLTECQAFAQMATAMFNNLHASTGASYSISAS